MKILNELEKCLKRGLLRKAEPSPSKSQLSIKEAQKWLTESKKNHESGAYSSALITTYLAIFHASRAILFRDGMREKSHYCTGVYLEAYHEKRLLEERWTLLFNRMRSSRHAGQYGFQTEPVPDEVESSLKSAEEFIKRMEKLLEETTPIGI